MGVYSGFLYFVVYGSLYFGGQHSIINGLCIKLLFEI